MKYCDNCKVDVATNDRACPLCQSQLTGEYDLPEVYLKLGTVDQSHKNFLSIIRFLLVTVMALSLLFNIFFPQSGAWSILVISAVACVWIWLHIAVRRRRGILKRLFDQVLVISALSIFWDYLIGWQGWSLNYIVPGVFICAMLTVSVLSVVLKISASDYIVYAVLLIIFGVVPAILLLTDLVNSPYVAVTCLCVSVLLLSKLLIFDWSVLHHEIQKRLHM